ncbi:hypothetical protein MMC24_000811 [Lignoscripta atroalba]|nr:hypothetical protein [Lignoscripta atroalba]
MDDDPFAFFISAEDDLDVFGEAPLSAGINRTKRPRSSSPLRRRKKVSMSVKAVPTTRIAKLKKWIDRMEKRYLHPVQGHSCDTPPQQPPALPTPPPPEIPSPYLSKSPITRGRREVRVGPSPRRLRHSRTHSGRPHVWREPSGDIWTVAEEQEGDEAVGLGIMI